MRGQLPVILREGPIGMRDRVNRVALINRSRIDIPQKQVGDRTRRRVRAGTIVIEGELACPERPESVGVIGGSYFPSELELVLAMQPG